MKPFAWIPAEGKPRTTSPGRQREPSITSVGVDDPDARAGEVELLLAVDAGQLGGLAADERAAGLATDGGGAVDELRDLLEIDPVRGDVVEQEEGLAPVVITSLMQCAARSTPHQRSAPARRARTSFEPTPSVEAARKRPSPRGWSPAKAPKPVAPVDSTAVRSRSTTDSATANETPAAS